MDAANAIGETNDLYIAKKRSCIHISGVDIFKGHIQPKSDTINLASLDLLTENDVGYDIRM